MGTINSLPLISQIKSFVQLLGQDYKGALQTQKDFSQQCIFIAPFRLFFEKIFISHEAASETSLKFTRALSNVLDALPLIGHVKGAIHYAFNDKEGGARALKLASRTIGVIAGGIAGSFGGPAGAIAGGLGGGQAMDGLTTLVDSLVHKEYRPNGSWAGIHKIVVGKGDVGEGFDTIAGLGLDAFAGYCCQGLGNTIKAANASRIGIADSGALARTAWDITLDTVSVSARTLSQRSSYEDLYPKPETTDMTKLRNQRQRSMENNNDLEGNHFKVKPGKLTYSLYKKEAILDASTYSIKFQTRNHQDKIQEIRVTVSQASKSFILLAKATKSPNHLAIVFENDFAISWEDDTYKKKLLVLHAYPIGEKTQPKVQILVEFFDTFQEIEKELFGEKSNNYSYQFSEAGISYVGLQAFTKLFANVAGKDFIWEAPLLMHVEEAKKNKCFVNCKRFATMLCETLNLKLQDGIKKEFLNMDCFSTKQREKVNANGWKSPELLWNYA